MELEVGGNAVMEVGAVVLALSEKFGSRFKEAILGADASDPRQHVLILKNGVEVGALQGVKTPVTGGDELVIIPISHGG